MGSESHVKHVGERKADSRGRVAIGTEYSDSTVEVVVIEVDDEEQSENQRANS